MKRAAVDALPLNDRWTIGNHSTAPPCVLIAEPHDETRQLYRQLLTLAGCEVIEASDGRDALTQALVHQPTLIITETRLPLVDGYALCEILRQDSATRTAAILVVTADAGPTVVERMQKAGADAVLLKPTLPGAMMNEMRRLIARDGAATKIGAASIPSSQPQACADHPHMALAKSHPRFKTTTPPAAPPQLMCPSCDRPLGYDHSHVGGVSARQPEQWDYFTCASCGTFQYRHRTRKLRPIA